MLTGHHHPSAACEIVTRQEECAPLRGSCEFESAISMMKHAETGLRTDDPETLKMAKTNPQWQNPTDLATL